MVISGPLILIGITPLCLGGTLSVDLTVPIVVLWEVACEKAKKSAIPLYVALLVLISGVGQ